MPAKEKVSKGNSELSRLPSNKKTFAMIKRPSIISEQVCKMFSHCWSHQNKQGLEI